MRILILTTDIYTRGGIARYTATLAGALGQLLGQGSVDLLPLLSDPERSFTPESYRILQGTTQRLTRAKKSTHVTRALWQAASRYDLVFCSHASLAPIAALIKTLYGTPYVVVCYGSEVWDRLPLVKRLALQRASLVLADSRFTAALVAEANGIVKPKIKLLLNAIPTELVTRLVGPNREHFPGLPERPALAHTRRFAVPFRVNLQGEPFKASLQTEGAGRGFHGEPPVPKRLSDNSWIPAFAGMTGRNNSPGSCAVTPAQAGVQAAEELSHTLPKGAGSFAQKNGPVLLSVASLRSEYAYKGVDVVIEALGSILEVFPGAHYVVVGDGDNRENLRRMAVRRGISAQVTFAGEVSDAELAESYRASDVFVLPSRACRRMGRRNTRTEGEGFGRVYVEAALAGKPVVGSREGGAAEAVLDGRTGLLVNPRSAAAVAWAVIALLSDPERAAAMGAEGRRWALENFTVEAMQRSLEEILPSLVVAKPARAPSAPQTTRRVTNQMSTEN